MDKSAIIMVKKSSFIAAGAVLLGTMAASAATPPPPQVLPNGAQVVAEPLRMAPYASMTILVKAGAADETAGTVGWRQLLVGAMMRATTNGKDVLNGPQLFRASEAAGGQISVQVLDDAIAFTASGDSATQKELATLLMNVVLHPRLSDAEFTASRRAMLMQLNLADRNDVPDHSRATETLQSLLYSDASSQPLAYGLPPEGTVDSLTKLDDQTLRDLYQKYFSPQHMVISLNGDVDEVALKNVFAQMPSSFVKTTETPLSYAKLTPSPLRVIQMNTDAPWVLIGFRIDSPVADSGNALTALRVLTAAMAQTAPSLLSQKLLVPERKGSDALAQEVSGQLLARRNGNELVVSVQSDAKHLDAAKNAILQIVDEMKTKPLSPAQLQAAIAYSKGDWAVIRDSSSNRAVLTGYAKAQGLFPDDQWPARLNTVTAAEVQSAAQKYLGQYAVVLVMPQKP